jgi:hypothetical protein
MKGWEEEKMAKFLGLVVACFMVSGAWAFPMAPLEPKAAASNLILVAGVQKPPPGCSALTATTWLCGNSVVYKRGNVLKPVNPIKNPHADPHAVAKGK